MHSSATCAEQAHSPVAAGEQCGMSPLKMPPSHDESGLPSNTWFLGLTQACSTNGILIGTAVFAQLTHLPNTHRQTDTQITLRVTSGATAYMHCGLKIREIWHGVANQRCAIPCNISSWRYSGGVSPPEKLQKVRNFANLLAIWRLLVLSLPGLVTSYDLWPGKGMGLFWKK